MRKMGNLGILALLGAVFGLNTATAGTALHFTRKASKLVSVESLEDDHEGRMDLNAERYFVVQYKSSVTETDKELLASQGVKLFQYIPDDAFIVRGTLGSLKALANESTIQQIVPYLPTWKLSTHFGPMSVFNHDVRVKFVLKTFEREELDRILYTLPTSAVVSASEQYLVGELSNEEILHLSHREGVHWIQPYVEMKLAYEPIAPLEERPSDVPPAVVNACDQLVGTESGTHVMNFESAWSRGLNGRGQIVTVADTGLDTGDLSTLHPDFKNTVKGYIFGLYAEDWADNMGHGTHVSGSVLGNGAGCDGKLKGGAFEAGLIAQGMWSPMMNNLTVPTKLADLFSPAYEDGSRIHTNSWGSPMNPGAYDNSAAQVDQFMWDHPDFLVLFAAGNSGVDMDQDGRIDSGSLGTPSTAKNTLTVGASENLLATGGIQKKLGELREGMKKWGVEPLKSDTLSNNPNGIAAFSSRGPTTDGRIKPDVVAPGTNIVSNASHMPDAEPLWGKLNDDYAYSGGTSMSTPLVAGAAAVVRQYLVETLRLTPSAALIKGVLMQTATDIYPGQYGEVGKEAGQEILSRRPNNDEGFGRVNVESATNLGNHLLIDEKNGVKQGETLTYTVTSSRGVKALLIYTDAPADPGVNKALVNDLDLEITDPSGQVHKLNDTVNNSEYIEVSGNQRGTYTLHVKGTKIPQGKEGYQPFALVVSQ